jgi:phospholipase/lecithinase/hemolysin
VNEIDFARTLYILEGGGNDLIFGLTLGGVVLLPDVIVASLFKSVQALLDIGAKNILVFNQPPVQYFPFSKPYNSPELFIYLTDQANLDISNLTQSMQLDNPQASLNIFDFHSLILNIVTENSTYFTNTVDNCWLYVNVTTVLEFCSNPDEYLFVDVIHLTSRAYGLIADAVRPFLFNSTGYENSTTLTTTSITANTTTTGTAASYNGSIPGFVLATVFVLLCMSYRNIS